MNDLELLCQSNPLVARLVAMGGLEIDNEPVARERSAMVLERNKQIALSQFNNAVALAVECLEVSIFTDGFTTALIDKLNSAERAAKALEYMLSKGILKRSATPINRDWHGKDRQYIFETDKAPF